MTTFGFTLGRWASSPYQSCSDSCLKLKLTSAELEQSALLSGILIVFNALTYFIFRSTTFLTLLLLLELALFLLLA